MTNQWKRVEEMWSRRTRSITILKDIFEVVHNQTPWLKILCFKFNKDPQVQNAALTLNKDKNWFFFNRYCATIQRFQYFPNIQEFFQKY